MHRLKSRDSISKRARDLNSGGQAIITHRRYAGLRRDQCHHGVMARLLRRRQNVEPKIYTNYLIVIGSSIWGRNNVGNDILRTQRYNQPQMRGQVSRFSNGNSVAVLERDVVKPSLECSST
ncbi:hypothetical protein DY000_02021534 [Brassica cretica]|uniref:Uncharacterized protein n=1 Tax=Brassica cretica TaxID=69181 RepID=A0ABQ7EJD8_BRACR|nr:hypothetical protein DY000_02021534 [Brassica cretica]